MLGGIEGLISAERFHGLTDRFRSPPPSVCEDQDAIRRWRTLAADHRGAQAQRRTDIFDNARLRIPSVIHEYGAFDWEQALQDSRAAHPA